MPKHILELLVDAKTEHDARMKVASLSGVKVVRSDPADIVVDHIMFINQRAMEVMPEVEAPPISCTVGYRIGGRDRTAYLWEGLTSEEQQIITKMFARIETFLSGAGDAKESRTRIEEEGS